MIKLDLLNNKFHYITKLINKCILGQCKNQKNCVFFVKIMSIMSEFALSSEQFKPPVQEQQTQQPQQTVDADLPAVPNSAGEQKVEEYVNCI
ncbi:MAG: hypothetical protein AAB453_01790 [Patescibacteria group bacterium]